MKLRGLFTLILSVLILLSLVGCGAIAEDSAMAIPGAVGNDYVVKNESSVDSENSSSLPENRKLIQTANINVETEDLDAVLQQVQERTATLGGYIESSNVQNGSAYSGKRYRNASLTIRVPAESLDQFIDKVGEITNIVSSQKTVDDVTLSYVATESRMNALQAEESRLLELITQAETMDDLLTINARLTDVRAELEEVTSTLRVLDNQVDYATLYLNVEEVTEYTEVTEPETIWQQISAGFKKSLKNVGIFLKELFVGVIVAIPYLVLIGIATTIAIGIIRIFIRKKKKTNK